jgi:hypothetical protein
VSPQHSAPGAEQDRAVLRAQLQEIALILKRAPVGAWHRAGHTCRCWACAIGRVIRYAG